MTQLESAREGHVTPEMEFVAKRERLEAEIRARCEVRATAEVLAPGTLPKTEFKAQRVKDRRYKPQAER